MTLVGQLDAEDGHVEIGDKTKNIRVRLGFLEGREVFWSEEPLDRRLER